jgi:hypothetical protein
MHIPKWTILATLSVILLIVIVGQYIDREQLTREHNQSIQEKLQIVDSLVILKQELELQMILNEKVDTKQDSSYRATQLKNAVYILDLEQKIDYYEQLILRKDQAYNKKADETEKLRKLLASPDSSNVAKGIDSLLIRVNKHK